MVQDNRQLKIREMEEGEEFTAWLRDVCEEAGSDPALTELGEDHHLVLTDELGDWIGGLRWSLRGGVAQVLEVAVVPRERHLGHAHRLLDACEQHATGQGAKLLEIWTDNEEEEGFLSALGWQRLLRREGYIGGRTWYLLDKPLSGS